MYDDVVYVRYDRKYQCKKKEREKKQSLRILDESNLMPSGYVTFKPDHS